MRLWFWGRSLSRIEGNTANHTMLDAIKVQRMRRLARSTETKVGKKSTNESRSAGRSWVRTDVLELLMSCVQ